MIRTGCCLAALCLAGCGEDRAGAERQIRAGEAAWTTAGLHHDGKAVAAILADDFVGVNPDGSVWTKSQMVADAAAGPGEQLAAVPGPLTIRFVGDTALVQGRSDWTRRSGSGHYVWADTWVRRSGRWQVAMSADVEVKDR